MENDNGQNEVPPQFIRGKAYDILKMIALVILPAIGALYFSLGQIWGFPNIEQVLGTIASIETFLGIILGFSASNYKKRDDRFDGVITIDDRGDTTLASMEHNRDPREFGREAIYKVVHEK